MRPSVPVSRGLGGGMFALVCWSGDGQRDGGLVERCSFGVGKYLSTNQRTRGGGGVATRVI